MTNENAQFFWERYLGLIGKGGSHNFVSNPLKELLAQIRSDTACTMSDEQFQQRKQEASELSLFWENKPEDTVGNILINALSKTDLSKENLKTISMILADASELTDYQNLSQSESSWDEKTEDDEDWMHDGWEDASTDNPFMESPVSPNLNYIWTPRDIYDQLDKHIHGQDAAKRAASMLMYHHLQHHKRHLIMTGPSGCGKTEIWRILSSLFSCIKIINGPQLSCDGWKGSYHIKDIFYEEPIEKAKNLVIVIDEADKLFEPMISSGGTDHARMIQNELLKIMDGDIITFHDDNNKTSPRTINCKNVSVVFCGTFEFMNDQITSHFSRIGFSDEPKCSPKSSRLSEENFIQYANIRREIIGRVNQIVTLMPLTESDFKAILEGPASPIQKLSRIHRVRLYVDDETKHHLAKSAAESGLGCRYIRSRLQSLLDEQMFDTPNAKAYTLSTDQSIERKDVYAPEETKSQETDK